MPDIEDPEIRGFVLSSKLETYTEIAAAVADRFGSYRAWPVEMIRSVRAHRTFDGSPYEKDAEVMAFVADHLGNVTLDRMLAKGLATFGPRFPSRTALGRLTQKLRHTVPVASRGTETPPAS